MTIVADRQLRLTTLTSSFIGCSALAKVIRRKVIRRDRAHVAVEITR